VTGITKLFAAVRKQVKDPRYAVSRPGSAPPAVEKTGAGKNQQARVATDEKSKKPE
jgi:hypothetical protein